MPTPFQAFRLPLGFCLQKYVIFSKYVVLFLVLVGSLFDKEPTRTLPIVSDLEK